MDSLGKTPPHMTNIVPRSSYCLLQRGRTCSGILWMTRHLYIFDPTIYPQWRSSIISYFESGYLTDCQSMQGLIDVDSFVWLLQSMLFSGLNASKRGPDLYVTPLPPCV